MYTGVHLDVSQENLSFEFFDLPFDHVHWCTLDVKENRDSVSGQLSDGMNYRTRPLVLKHA